MNICKFSLVSLFITLSVMLPLSAQACKPAPGSKPASIAQKIKKTPYVFKGTVTDVKGSILTIRVYQSIKGATPKLLRLDGFNKTSCDTRITKTGETFLFFAKATAAQRNAAQPWDAVYDGAYGAVSGWSKSTIADLKKLGFKIK
jgi:hypothetical protein